MTETERVPALRSDLVLSAQPQATGLQTVNIKDPVSQQSMDVRGFELSVCRMINGQRTAGEVCGAAQAIGIPLTLERLAALLRRLEALGLLAKPSAPVGAAMAAARSLTWSGRAQWSAETRAFYQHALKEARLDRLEEAKRDVTALLEKAPSTDEAKVLLEWIEQQIASKAAGAPRQTFAEVFAEVEHEWASEESVRLERESTRRAKRRRRLLPSLLGVLVVLLFVPLPYHVTAQYRLEPAASEQVLAHHEGRLAEVAVKEGQWVEANAVLARFEDRGREGATELKEARQQLAQAQAAKKRARRVVERMATQKRVTELEEEVRRLEGARMVKSTPDPVRAPLAGTVRALVLGSGAQVEVGQELCRIDAAKRLAVVVELPVGVAADPKMSVNLGGREIELTRDTVVDRIGRGEIDAAEKLEAGARGEVTVALGWRSFVRR